MSKVKITAKVVKKIDPKKLDEIINRVKGLDRVAVGVPSSENARSDEVTNAMLAAIMEYGAPSAGIPERPFLRNTVRANLDNYKRLNRINIIKVLRGEMSMEQALDLLGVMAVGHVQKFVYSNTYVLKESTIKAKGSSRALIDTAQLVQSINYEKYTGALS
jgi:hypothetical protein